MGTARSSWFAGRMGQRYSGVFFWFGSLSVGSAFRAALGFTRPLHVLAVSA
jgi:hypothetical protein